MRKEPWVSASGDEVCDISQLVPSLSFWARGRVGNTAASNANLHYRVSLNTIQSYTYDSQTTLNCDACNAPALTLVPKIILNTTLYQFSRKSLLNTNLYQAYLNNASKHYSLSS